MGHAIAMKEAYSRQQLMKSRCNLPSAGRTVNIEPIAFGDFGFHVPEAGSWNHQLDNPRHLKSQKVPKNSQTQPGHCFMLPLEHNSRTKCNTPGVV